jgi:hypothetical protein
MSPGIREGAVKWPTFDSFTHSQRALASVYNKDLRKFSTEPIVLIAFSITQLYLTILQSTYLLPQCLRERMVLLICQVFMNNVSCIEEQNN